MKLLPEFCWGSDTGPVKFYGIRWPLLHVGVWTVDGVEVMRRIERPATVPFIRVVPIEDISQYLRDGGSRDRRDETDVN